MVLDAETKEMNLWGCLVWWFWVPKQRKWMSGDVCSGGSWCWNKGHGLMGMFEVMVLGAQTKKMDLCGCYFGFLVQSTLHSPLCRRTQGWKEARLCTCDTQRQNLVYLELSRHDIRARLPAYLELHTHDTRSNQIFSSPLGVQYTWDTRALEFINSLPGAQPTHLDALRCTSQQTAWCKLRFRDQQALSQACDTLFLPAISPQWCLADSPAACAPCSQHNNLHHSRAVAYSPHLFPVSQLSLPLPAANPQINSPSLCQTQQNILSSYKSKDFTANLKLVLETAGAWLMLA